MHLIHLPYILAALTLQAQAPPPPPDTVPLYRVAIVQSSAKAINYRYMKSSTKIDFKGTVLAPKAEGMAKISSEATTTHIKAKFESLPSPSQFGPEYLTYVMWAISPEGRATNLGELLVKRGKAKLQVTEPLQTFGLIVTAEPYFAVTQPSDAVVLENSMRPDTEGKVELIDAKFDLLKRGIYHLDTMAAAPAAMDPATPFSVYQARNAVAIAKAEGAGTYAAEAFGKAEGQLAQSESTTLDTKERSRAAREAVQSAEDARSISVKRAQAEAQEKEKAQVQARLEEARKESEASAREVDQAHETLATAAQAQREAKREVSDLRAQLLTQLNAVLETRATARGLIVNMAGMTFKTGASELLPASREKLAKIAGIILAHPGLKVETDGYTDSTGSPDVNIKLSTKRAEAARDFLVAQGVPPDAIVFHGFGEADPIDTNANPAGRQRNRRVELVVSGAGITGDLPK